MRERIIAASLDALRPVRRPWFARPLALVPAGAGAVALLALALLWPQPLDPPSPGARLVATEQALSWRIGDHQLTLQPGGQTRFNSSSADQIDVVLDTGTMRFDIAPLRASGRVSVQTAQVEVVVKGTRFTVQVDDCTSVDVSRGQVQIQERASQRVDTLSAGSERRYCTQPPADSDLAGTDLVQAAMAQLLAPSPNLDLAADRLQRYLQQFPDGALAEEALFHLSHVQRQQGHVDEARATGRQFIQRYPDSRRAIQLREWLDLGAEEQP